MSPELRTDNSRARPFAVVALALGFGDHGGRGDGPGLRERAEDRVQAEEVVAVAVGDVDRGEILSGRLDPLYDVLRVLGGEAALIRTASRSPVISETEVAGQVASPLLIGVSARRWACTG
jgi:hypothetical protein